MSNTNTIEDTLPKWLIKQLLDAYLKKMELVTREEFDIQSQVLAKTRKKIRLLEAQLGELEQLLAKLPQPDSCGP